MSSLLVKRGAIEQGQDHAGHFAANEFGKGLIPGALLRGLGSYCVDTTDLVYAITYDDGPDPTSTPQILDMLGEHGARATFFLLAEPARQHPDIVHRIASEGHEVALHGANHRSLLTLSAREAATSVREARAVVEAVAQRPIRLFRPPYGSHTVTQAWGFLRQDLELALWSSDALDWIDGEESVVAERAIKGVFPGAVLLLHDTRADPETLHPGEQLPAFDRAKVLERILRTTRAMGYRELTMSELLGRYPRVKSVSRQTLLRGLGAGR